MTGPVRRGARAALIAALSAIAIAAPAIPGARAQQNEAGAPSGLAKLFATPRKFLRAQLTPGAGELVSVDLDMLFEAEGLSASEIDNLIAIVPYAIARCIAADYAVKHDAARIALSLGENTAKLGRVDGEKAVASISRHGFRVTNELTADGESVFDADRMQQDCAANDSIPGYDVIERTQ